ncbi:hypothetical protein PR048_005543 [Dryococelus australis]|uniref:Uncharacterized protein n=1 Tax=Dryococelus australis TaxID=614101 RepID=A0ABQ9I8G4_9NEOP|nr:hypothetical protein PR048_005543 [Dryococelus australis]
MTWLSEYNCNQAYKTFYQIYSCERGFSQLYLVKTKLRSAMMTQYCLQIIMLPYIEQSLAKSVQVADNC